MQKISWKTGLNSRKGGGKTGGRPINNLKYVNNTILLALNSSGDLKKTCDESERRKYQSRSALEHDCRSALKHKNHDYRCNFNLDNEDTEIVKYFACLGTSEMKTAVKKSGKG